MAQSFFIPATIPGFNEFIRLAGQLNMGAFAQGGPRVNRLNELKKKIQSRIQMELKTKELKPMLSAYFFFHYLEKSRARDKDNIASIAKKIIFDALVEEGILRNDGWFEIAGWQEQFSVSKARPGIHVSMMEPGFVKAGIIATTYECVTNELEKWQRLKGRK